MVRHFTVLVISLISIPYYTTSISVHFSKGLNEEPSFQWSNSRSTADNDITLTAHYADGDNYTNADQFYFTLPDLTTLEPGNSRNEYRALPVYVPERDNYHSNYDLVIQNGTINGEGVIKSFTFTASGPANPGSQERWSVVSDPYEVKFDPFIENEIPTVTALPYQYNPDGSVVIQYQVSGAEPEEDSVRWIWDSPPFDLSQGESFGSFRVLTTKIENGASKIYSLRIESDAVKMYSQSYTFHVEAIGHWTKESSHSFLADQDGVKEATDGGGDTNNAQSTQQVTIMATMMLFSSALFLL